METSKLLDLKRSNLLKAINREEGAYVPNMINASCAPISWVGKNALDVVHDPEAYAEALTALYSDVWADANIMSGTLFTEQLAKTFDPIQYKFGPDGTTPEHVQLSLMEKDEYPQLIADPDRYVSEVLLPRKYAKLFEDREYAKNALKVYAEDKFYSLVVLSGAVDKILAERYGIGPVLNLDEFFDNPMDILFDSFRGFRGTLTDLRRQPANVKAAIDKLWDTRCMPKAGSLMAPSEYWGSQFPHIPAYLSPKQFEELYWPYEKKLIERIAQAGGKAYIVLEGRWEKIWHHFLELPKDCCVLHIDDDDFLKAHAELGHHQILCGGIKTADTRMKSFDQIKDDVKRVIDTCAPGGGFLLCTDKCWIAPGDVNKTLVDAFNFAHEYSSK